MATVCSHESGMCTLRDCENEAVDVTDVKPQLLASSINPRCAFKVRDRLEGN